MEKILLVLIFAGAIFMSGCRQNGLNADEVDNPSPLKGENFSFFTSETMYNEVQEKRSNDISTPFEITEVWRTKESDITYLHIEIKHQKACDDEFEVIWDGRIAESSPPQLFFFIKLNAGDCPDLNDFATDTLSLDLYKFIDDKSLADEAMFNVSNASSAQNVNYDEPVSDS